MERTKIEIYYKEYEKNNKNHIRILIYDISKNIPYIYCTEYKIINRLYIPIEFQDSVDNLESFSKYVLKNNYRRLYSLKYDGEKYYAVKHVDVNYKYIMKDILDNIHSRIVFSNKLILTPKICELIKLL